MFCMCRTCLNESNGNLISIHSDVAYDQNGLSTKSENRMQIANIIDEITGNKYVRISCFFGDISQHDN